jgi:integrase/recombinase XerD
MKRDIHGRARILTQDEIQLLFSQGLANLRDRSIFAVMLYSAIRVNKACSLLTEDVYDKIGECDRI